MAQADVLSLVNTFSNGVADQALAAQFYAEIVNEWGGLDLLTVAQEIAVTANQNEISAPNTVLDILKVIFDDTELGYLSLRQLEELDPEWRLRKGTPSSWTTEQESAKSFAVYPNPFAPSGNPSLQLGADYQPYHIVICNTETRANVLPYLELPLTFLILEREYERESDHVNPPLAQACGAFGRLLLEIAK